MTDLLHDVALIGWTAHERVVVILLLRVQRQGGETEKTDDREDTGICSSHQNVLTSTSEIAARALRVT